MNNKYFQLLGKTAKSRQQSIHNQHNSKKVNPGKKGILPRGLSYSESFAYKFWAIARQYSASDYFIDEVPFFFDDMNEFINILGRANISSIVVIGSAISHIPELKLLGCQDLGDCKLFLQERQAYKGELEIYRGKRIKIPRRSTCEDYPWFFGSCLTERYYKKQKNRLHLYYDMFQFVT